MVDLRRRVKRIFLWCKTDVMEVGSSISIMATNSSLNPASMCIAMSLFDHLRSRSLFQGFVGEWYTVFTKIANICDACENVFRSRFSVQYIPYMKLILFLKI